MTSDLSRRIAGSPVQKYAHELYRMKKMKIDEYNDIKKNLAQSGSKSAINS